MLLKFSESKRLLTSKDVHKGSIDHYEPKVFKTGLKSKQDKWIVGAESKAKTQTQIEEAEAQHKRRVHKRVNRSVGGLTDWIETRLQQKYAEWEGRA